MHSSMPATDRVDVEATRRAEVFAPLEDPAELARVKVDPDLGTVVWPNPSAAGRSATLAARPRERGEGSAGPIFNTTKWYLSD